MNVVQLVKYGFCLVLIGFQVLPIAFLAFHGYHFSQREDQGGWVADPQTGCQCYTNLNADQRIATWSGDCLNGRMNGKGILDMYEAGLKLYKFDGQLIRGKAEGTGRLVTRSDGDTYEGSFHDGRLNGFGRFYNDDGDHFEGFFVDGLKNGTGTLWYEPDHALFKYAGHWKNDLQHGEGRLFYRNGEIKDVLFEEGQLKSSQPFTEHISVKIPKNILITNDDGVEDLDRLICLAEELSAFADEVIVVASSKNRSGTSNIMSVIQQGFLESRLLKKDAEKNIEVYEVDGYPADCVLLGSMGIFQGRGKTVDLVISGINGGANHGAAWFGSGTIGAARTAALGGVPAIAVSGINEDDYDAGNLKRICSWVAQFVQSGILDHMNPQEYLTISIPENLDEIIGTKVVPRAITFNKPPFKLTASSENESGKREKLRWTLSFIEDPAIYDMAEPHDVSYYFQNYIVIVPMHIDENSVRGLPRFQQVEHLIQSIPINKQ